MFIAIFVKVPWLEQLTKNVSLQTKVTNFNRQASTPGLHSKWFKYEQIVFTAQPISWPC